MKKNKHGDHVATCFCCQEFEVGFEYDLSDITPGAGLEIHCRKDLGPFIGNRSTRADYHKAIHRAVTCKDFNPTEEK